MTKWLYGCMILYSLFMACATPSTQVATPPSPTPTPEIKVETANTTCATLADIDPVIRSDVEDAFTLYRDQIRFENYPAAKDLWKTAYYSAPGANGKATYHFDDGIKIYDYLFENEDQESRKAALVDTIISIYDKRVECFADDGTILARKAFNSYYKYSKYIDGDDVFAWFREVVRMKDIETDYFVINPLSKLLYDRLLEEEISHEEGSQLSLKILEIVEYGVAHCEEKYCEAWYVIDQYSPPLLSGLEGIKGFYPCSYFMDHYYSQFEANPDDCDDVTEVYLKMVWGGCDPSDPRLISLKEAKDKECYVPPPPPGPLTLAYGALEAGEFRESITHFEDYINNSDDAEKRAKYQLVISKIYYAHIKNFPLARKYARAAASEREEWGEPYMLIGKLYASSGPLCGPGTGFDSQIVTWAAIDKFEYAKKVDPTVSSEANEWIKKYRQYMPTKEDIFFRQLKAGSSFRVPCWIQEDTIVRTVD